MFAWDDVTTPATVETLDDLIAALQHIRKYLASAGGPLDPSLRLDFADGFDPNVLALVYDEEDNRVRLS